MTITGLEYDDAERVLREADGHVKTALVMSLAGVSRDEARDRLNRHSGFVRPAIQE